MKSSLKKSTIILAVSVALYLIVVLAWITGRFDQETLIGLVGVITAMTFFFMQNELEGARFKRELFVAFNQTYSQLNNKLDDALTHAREGKLDDVDKKYLQDYFNLCGEEYFYKSMGYVDKQVWCNWLMGMNWWYDASDQIAAYWQEELKKGSYYGLNLSILRKNQMRS